jgi:hypothetical protein
MGDVAINAGRPAEEMRSRSSRRYVSIRLGPTL